MRPQLKPFTVNGTPLLSSGNTMDVLASAPSLWAHVKVYADGGENSLHAHPQEDHLFFVLQGKATFFNENNEEIVTGVNDGIIVPGGAIYSFRAGKGENLILLRIGTAVDTSLLGEDTEFGFPKAITMRTHPDGSQFRPDDEANKTGAVRGIHSGAKFVCDR